jgi:hypothetical protein
MAFTRRHSKSPKLPRRPKSSPPKKMMPLKKRKLSRLLLQI